MNIFSSICKCCNEVLIKVNCCFIGNIFGTYQKINHLLVAASFGSMFMEEHFNTYCKFFINKTLCFISPQFLFFFYPNFYFRCDISVRKLLHYMVFIFLLQFGQNLRRYPVNLYMCVCIPVSIYDAFRTEMGRIHFWIKFGWIGWFFFRYYFFNIYLG